MNIALDDVYRKVDEETAACVERKRNKPFFQFAWIRSRQSYEPGCRSEVTAKYQGDITAAQQLKFEQEQNLFAAAQQELAGGDTNKTITIIIIVLIALIIIAWILS